MTLNMSQHYLRHDMSLPLSLLVKGMRGRSGWGLGIKGDFVGLKGIAVDGIEI
jgi:hypothetical protein